MTHEPGLPHGHLYDIAWQAQEKARRARQRKLKNTARANQGRQAVRKTGTHHILCHDGASVLQRRGYRGEDHAADFLQKQGLSILERNIHCRGGEIDLVATNGTTLIFVEVRLRQSRRYGGAAASVDARKQRRLVHTAQYFLPWLSKRYFSGDVPPCRFDVVSIDLPHLTWIRHAFDQG